MKTSKLSLFLFLPFLLGVVGCGGGGDNKYNDRDHDGLYDKIDPAPDDNTYDFHLVKVNEEGELAPCTNKRQITVDYRNLVNHGDSMNKELAKFGAFLTNEFESTLGYPKITKNVYTSKDSDHSPIMAQVGLVDVEEVGVEASEVSQDLNDRSTVLCGHHIYKEDGSNKLDNVFVFGIKPYVYREAEWNSNFDIGAGQTNEAGAQEDANYLQFINETSVPEWTDKRNHKGFDVTANRLVPKIKKYVNDHQVNGTETKIFIVGHSRGGALTNLITKKLVDENIAAIGYCLETPNCSSAPKSELEKYTSIYNAICTDDLVPDVPCATWGGAEHPFSHYGKTVTYSVNDTEAIKNEWNSFFLNQQYECLGTELKTKLIGIMGSWADGRPSAYTYRSPSQTRPELEKWSYDTEEEANDKANDLRDFEEGQIGGRAINVTVSQEGDKYVVELKTKPCLLVACFHDILMVASKPDMEILDVLKVVFKYLDVFNRYLIELDDGGVPILDIIKGVQGVIDAHTSSTSLVGANYI